MVVVKKPVKVLKKDGWVLVSQKGSHMKFKKENLCLLVLQGGINFIR